MISKLIPKGRRRRNIIRQLFFEPRVPIHISNNFRQLDDLGLNSVKESLKKNYFSKNPEAYFSTDIGKNDLSDHLLGRLEYNRKRTIPWLDNAKPRRNSTILEIGCGTGCSTVALAEQGAKVIAIDVDEKALIDHRFSRQ